MSEQQQQPFFKYFSILSFLQIMEMSKQQQQLETEYL